MAPRVVRLIPLHSAFLFYDRQIKLRACSYVTNDDPFLARNWGYLWFDAVVATDPHMATKVHVTHAHFAISPLVCALSNLGPGGPRDRYGGDLPK